MRPSSATNRVGHQHGLHLPEERQGTSLRLCRVESGKNEVTPPMPTFPQEAGGNGQSALGQMDVHGHLSLTLGQVGRDWDGGGGILGLLGCYEMWAQPESFTLSGRSGEGREGRLTHTRGAKHRKLKTALKQSKRKSPRSGRI